MLGFNPYMLLGGAGLVLAATTGAFFEGKKVEAGEIAQQQSKQLADAIKDGKDKGTKITQLEGERQALENLRLSAVREIYHDTSKIIERPVYKNVCIDSDGVSLLDHAQAIASGHSAAGAGQPSGPPPGPTKGPTQR